MKIDDSIIKSYLESQDDYEGHWIFKSILDSGEYVFDKPSYDLKDKTEKIYTKIYGALKDFTPCNKDLFSKLFPKWRELLKDVNIILAVGCPSPYDAMTREHNGKEYIIFDLIRFLDYEKENIDILSVISRMITHEFSHACLHSDYPLNENSYKDKLIYTTFDEGFAHLLSFTNNITEYNFKEIIQLHYKDSIKKLEIALNETNVKKQEEYLEESNCGQYWDKFAAISGKLYLASNINNLYPIYKNGPSLMVKNMLG